MSPASNLHQDKRITVLENSLTGETCGTHAVSRTGPQSCKESNIGRLIRKQA